MLEDISKQAADAAAELLEAAHLKEHDLVVIGCSSSEIAEYRIGSHSSEEIGEAVFTAVYQVLSSHGIDVAAQCCEHLNRALILEAEAAARYGYEPVNAVPQLKAGVLLPQPLTGRYGIRWQSNISRPQPALISETP